MQKFHQQNAACFFVLASVCWLIEAQTEWRHLADDIFKFKRIFLNENCCIVIKI